MIHFFLVEVFPTVMQLRSLDESSSRVIRYQENLNNIKLTHELFLGGKTKSSSRSYSHNRFREYIIYFF